MFLDRNHKFFLQLNGNKHLVESKDSIFGKVQLCQDRQPCFKEVNLYEFKKNGAEFSLTVENMAGLQFTVAYIDGSDKMKLQVEGQDFDNLD